MPGRCEGEAATPSEKVLYVFAHQDDEADVVAKIVVDVRAGREVHCVWVTDGGHGGSPDVREKETRAVMSLLGVPRGNLHFLGYPDQGAYKHLAAITRKLTDIAEAVKPVEIMSHAYEGGNIDHDAVSLTAHLAAKKLDVTHLEFPDTNIYKGKTQIWQFLPRANPTTIHTTRYTPLDKELYDLKMKVLRMYPSQSFGLRAYELGMDKKSLKEKGEPYRVALDYDYTKPPADALRYAITSKGQVTYEMWQKAVAGFLKSATD